MSPQVLNRADLPGKRIPQGAVYVGRPTEFGNPFVIGRDGSREEVIEKFRRYILGVRDVQGHVAPLVGKDLVCWCAPKPCHADVLLELANGHLQRSARDD